MPTLTALRLTHNPHGFSCTYRRDRHPITVLVYGEASVDASSHLRQLATEIEELTGMRPAPLEIDQEAIEKIESFTHWPISAEQRAALQDDLDALHAGPATAPEITA